MRFISRLAALTFTLAAATSLASSQAAAQAGKSSEGEAARPPDAVPVIRADTHAVVVDVVLTQGHDEPVTALHKQDFVLTEDSKVQAIDFFEEHSTPPAMTNALAPLSKMPPHVYTNIPAAPMSDSVNVLLLDSLNTPRQDQSYVHQQIVEFLKTMKPEARIAIFILGSKLRLVQGFTDDPALLKAALDDKQHGFQSETTNVSRTREDDQDDQQVILAKKEAFGGGARAAGTAGVAALTMAQADYVEMQADQRIAIMLDALQSLGRYLASIPGRKNLIWFASSYPVYVFPHSTEKQPLNYRREYVNEIKAAADLLTLSKVAVYPISAEGMMNDHGMESDSFLRPSMMDYQNEASERSARILGMEQLASDTGGEAIFNTNDLNTALNRAIHHGEHYYTIVYTPTNRQMNGQFRGIKIKLNGGKYKLSYRRGYYADMPGGAEERTALTGTRAQGKAVASSRGEAEGNPLQRLLGRGLPSATQVLFAVRVVPAAAAANAKRAGANEKLTGPTTRLVADFLIDAKMVQFETTADGKHAGRVRIELLAYDRDGKALNWNGSEIRTEMNAETYAGIQRSGLPAHLALDVPAETEVYLSTGVFDLNTGKAGTLEIPVDTTKDAVAAAAQATPKAQ